MEFNFATLKPLVVDDNDFVRCMIKKYLTAYGTKETLDAANGNEAITILPANPNLIICDIHMNPTDGFSLLKHVRNLPTTQSKIPFIFFTANADDEFLRRAKDLTVDAYLLKPISSDTLKHQITTLMTLHLPGVA